MGVRSIRGMRTVVLVTASMAATCGLYAEYRTPPDKAGVDRSSPFEEGTITFRFNSDLSQSLGFRLVPQGQLASDALDRTVVFELDLTAEPMVEFSRDGVGRLAGGPLATCGAFLLDRPGERVVIGNLTLRADAEGTLRLRSHLGDASDAIEPFDLGETWIDFDRRRGQWQMQCELLLNPDWAERLGIPAAAGVALGSVTIEALIAGRRSAVDSTPPGTCEPFLQLGTANATAATAGPDVLVADLQSVVRYAPVGNLHAFAVGTTACNIGTQRADWVSHTSQHPVIAQNLYRLRDDRFEQIGMSWVKHGFYAVSESYCGTCNDPTNGTALGVGCSDPYSANLNGVQTNMSPRSTVNANTGSFPYPWSGPAPQNSIERRIQVPAADLDPALNLGARYFVEGHYVLPDDCVVGTQDNNASYREVRVVVSSPGTYNLAVSSAWPTQRGQAAVRAWRDADPAVVEVDIRIPGEGLFILAAKASPLGNGYWRYVYALQNLNSDRSAGWFELNLPAGAVVENAQFHDIPYHSGEPFANAAWTAAISPTSITWSTDDYATNPDANALRFDTIANFMFDVNVEPDTAKVEIGLFKPGLPGSVTANCVGPRVDLVDCNANTIPDLCDVDCGSGCPLGCGSSLDCNGNAVPDECESDCNANGTADECDIDDCPPADLSCADCNHNLAPDVCDPDCDGDGVPDECELILDLDADGVDDCYDFCPTTTPQGSCLPPLDRIVVCCYPNGLYLVDLLTWRQCLSTGGAPVCDDPPMCPGTPCRVQRCRGGCLVGDSDDDGDLDLRDFSRFQECYGGGIGTPGYVTPPSWCLTWFDVAEDLDLDGEDYRFYADECSGPR